MNTAAERYTSAVVSSLSKETSTDMAKRRGRQQGHLKVEGPSWVGYWKEEVRLSDGSLKWHTFCKKICAAEQLSPLTKRLRKVTETEAQRLFNELILDKLEVSNTNPQTLSTLREFVVEKYEPSWSMKKRKTQEHLRNITYNHILPALGDKRMREIRLDDVQALIYVKTAKYSTQTVTHIRNTLSTIFRRAEQYGWFTGKLPTVGAEIKNLRHRSRTALSAEQLQLLLEHCDLRMYCVVLADALLGLRRGELAGLKWKRLNLTDQPVVIDGEVISPYTVAIREQYVWVFGKALDKSQRGGQYEDLKTDNGGRNIPITPALVAALSEMARRDKFVGPDDPVFCGRGGKPLDMPNYLARHFQPLLAALGLPKISWHDLRHTNATLSEIAGATQTNRNKVLGHGGDRIGRHYTHEDVAQARSALEKVEAAVLPKPKLKLVK